MKKIGLIVLILFLIGSGSFASEAAIYETKRTIKKSVDASNKNSLLISNRYGKIEIEAWNENKINIVINITGKHSANQEMARVMAERIEIDFLESGKMFSAITKFNEIPTKRKYSNDAASTTIDYKIMVPKSLKLLLDNRYGNIIIGEADGEVQIELKYGNFICGTLNNRNNKLSVAYGNVDIDNVGQLFLSLSYGNAQIEQTNELSLDSKYSNLKIRNVSKLACASRYDNVSIETVDEASIESAYSKIKIEKLNRRINVNARYGSFVINDININVSEIIFETAYTPINITMDPKACFTVDATIRYGNINLPTAANTPRKILEKSSQVTTLEAIVGSCSQPNTRINVSGRYANFTIKM